MRKHIGIGLLLVLLGFSLSSWAQFDTLSFSVPGGFYDEVFSLELQCGNPDYHIRFTTNGNEPTRHSQRYSEPLTLDERMYSKSNIYTVRNCPEDQFQVADSIERCIVIRAAVFDESDNCVSTVFTNSYFIKSLGCDLHGLPAVSLCVDSLDLFDYNKGIFVEGACYRTDRPHWSGNYYQHGREWERPANFEFYELDNTGINQPCGLRTHGGNGRRFQQKTLKIYARKDYGYKRFQYQFFKEMSLDHFKVLVLRPFLSSNGGCEDHISNYLAQQMGIEYMADRPSVMFINGEYWGIYYVKERPDEHYVEDHFGVASENVNLFWRWLGETENGVADSFKDLKKWMEKANLADDKKYAYVEERVDIENFINYYILEMFIANYDWPANNVRFWQVDDSKFRWLFYDGDPSLENPDFDVYANAVYDGDESYPSNRESTLFFRKFLESPKFRRQFADCFNRLIATTLSYNNTQKIYNDIKEALVEEARLQFDRFPRMESFYPLTHHEWFVYHMEGMKRKFLEERATYNFLSMKQPLVAAVDRFQYQNRIVLEVKTEEFGSEVIDVLNYKGEKVYSQVCVLAEGSNTILLNDDLPAGAYLLKVGKQAIRIIKY